MKILLFLILLISVSISAQEKTKKPLVPRVDTTQLYKMDSKNLLPPQKSDQRNMYKMPSAKPKEGTEYSGLRAKKEDATDYKMLNSITPEESQPKQENQKQLPLKNK